MRNLFCAGLLLAFVLGSRAGQAPEKRLKLEPEDRSGVPQIAASSDEGKLSLKRFKVPDGFSVELFAAEPMLANPVAFCLDERGRVFVSETYRYRSSALDIRNYMDMLEDDVICRTVEDRLEMTKRWFGTSAAELARETEIVRLVEDRNRDGVADFSTVYSGGYNSALDGIASGVLAWRGNVWFANIPEITLLKGINKDGRAKTRETFSWGYGVRYSYTGHDLHGLAFGPDGRLYFSFGDRGATVKTKEGKTLSFPDEGAVFRCNPDGSEMEVVHRGLRNPQELAFDEFGNLFTGDNDFDHGDKERWVYVVEGGDSGWRVGYQHPPLGYDLVPWKADKLWVPHFEGQAAYIVPPIANLDDGPSGLVYYPGTGLSSKYDGHFFLCQFKGNISKSGIQTFTVEPEGASFDLAKSKQFLWNVQATDVEFGPDSRIYFSDWGEGWKKTSRGRIYRLTDTNTFEEPIVGETQKLIEKGFDNSSQRELLKLLSHPNMRVRMESQFTLAERGGRNVKALSNLALDNSADPRARRHAIWALGQIGRKISGACDSLKPLLANSDPEIRAQAAKVIGEARVMDAAPALVPLLKDQSLRVRFFAAQSLGKLGFRDAFEPLVAMLAENNNRDVYLRHAGAFALSRCAEKSQLTKAAKHVSSAVRMAALLAMRHLELPEIAMFLKDADELLVAEAARAINDVPIKAAIPDLAAELNREKKFSDEHASHFTALQLRVVNANFHLGKSANAVALAEFAASEDASAVAAEESLNVLGIWADTGRRDRIVGTFRDYSGPRSNAVAARALGAVVTEIITGKRPERVKLAAIDSAVRLRLDNVNEPMRKTFAKKDNSEKLRLRALKALEELGDSKLLDSAEIAQADGNENIRKEGNRLMAQLAPASAALAQIRSVLEKGSIVEQQGALTSLAEISNTEADLLISEQVDRYISGSFPRELELELFEAVTNRPSLRQQLEQAQKADQNPLKEFRVSLYGGNAGSGKKIFFERVEASCVRCHKVAGEGGEAGPALTAIGGQKSREYLLESLVKPNAQIAPGFETLLAVMKSGASHAGVLKTETDSELVLNSPEDGEVALKKSEISSRKRGGSGMPEGLGQILSKRDIRDLIEYLAALK